MTPNRVKLVRAITFMKSLIGEKKEEEKKEKKKISVIFFPE